MRRWAYTAAIMLACAASPVRADWEGCMQNQDMQRKVENCSDVLQSDKYDAQKKTTARLHRGYAHRRSNNPVKALQDVEQVLHDSPRWGHAHYERGMLMIAEQSYFDAVSSLDRAVMLMPGKAFVLYARGEANYGLTFDLSAIQDFSEALRLSPEFHEAIEYRGRARCRQGQPNAALRDWAETRRLDETAAGRQRRWLTTSSANNSSASGGQLVADLQAFAAQGCPGL